MRINDSEFLIKALIILRNIYWVWLSGCFLLWLCWALALNGYIVEAIFRSTFQLYLYQLVSTALLTIVFIIISIVRRKVSAWELLVITFILILMFYFLSNFHT